MGGPFGMELRPPEVAAPDNGRKGCAVVRARKRHIRYRGGEAVNEINVVVWNDAVQKRVFANRREMIPTHVRNRAAGHRLQAFDGVGKNAEALCLAFFRSRK